ncbi:MAG: hypothetical protein Q8O56_06210 [Solirubrobacteraceae bacterium]|nr:hypothetical protein [Solirubrobacteraceae bacterium]
MTVCLLVMTDGRRALLENTIASLTGHLPDGLVARSILHDDSGDEHHRAWLRDRFGTEFEVTWPAAERAGQGAAIRSAWRQVSRHVDVDVRHVLHIEDDYLFHDLPLAAMIDLLDAHPHLRQVALLRQPWFRRERDAGGVFAAHPGEYMQRADQRGRAWVEHIRHWTFNPCVYPAALCRAGYIDGARHELRYGQRLVAENTKARFAYYGRLDDEPRVEHRGTERVGSGY